MAAVAPQTVSPWSSKKVMARPLPLMDQISSRQASFDNSSEAETINMCSTSAGSGTRPVGGAGRIPTNGWTIDRLPTVT